MDLFNYGFGKKRRTTRRKSSGARKMAKPPARLLKICKKYHVKATKKVGGKRVYRSVGTLKKMCLKKAMALKKKLKKMHKAGSKRRAPMRRTRRRRSMGFGVSEEETIANFSKVAGPNLYKFVTGCNAKKGMTDIVCRQNVKMNFGRRRSMGYGGMMMPQGSAFGEMTPRWARIPKFGKRRVGSKTGRKAAMKAFRSFYKRHCAGRRSGFGSGGNPPLYQSMGSEFCPNGMGGVLGATSTGLYPTPCVSSKSSSYGRRRRAPAKHHKTGVRHRRRSRMSSASMEFGRRRRAPMRRRRSRMSSASMEFGKKRRKYLLPRMSSASMEFGRRRACTRRPAKHRVKGSAPCTGLGRKVCKASGCSYVNTRRLAGCKRKGGRRAAMPAMTPMGNELALRFGRRRRSRMSV
jgi:hypothetical protein